MSFVAKDYVKFRYAVRNPYVLVEALHAVSPRAEFYTAEIAEGVSARAGCHCIVSTVSRVVADLNRYPDSQNRLAVEEYRQTIRGLLVHGQALDDKDRLTAPFLHLSLHGMTNRSYMDIELGTVFGESCSRKLLRWLSSHFNRWAVDLRDAHRKPIVVENEELFGEPVIATHRVGDGSSNYPGYGNRFNTVQIELAQWLRENHTEELVTVLTSIATDFPRAAGRKTA